jgi:DNA-binding XRE family transcriptional regulator
MSERPKRTFLKADRTQKQTAALRAERDRFTKTKPTMDELLASGEYEGPFEQGTYFDLVDAMAALKAERERLGISLAEAAERSGIDKAALSRLENGLVPNPTLSTLTRYAEAIGRRVSLSFPELEPVT